METTEVGVSVTIKRDVGYEPYIQYIQSLNGANPPFGTRDHSTQEINLWQKAIVEEGDDPLECANGMVKELRKQIFGIMGIGRVSDTGNSDDPSVIELVEVEVGIQEDDFE